MRAAFKGVNGRFDGLESELRNRAPSRESRHVLALETQRQGHLMKSPMSRLVRALATNIWLRLERRWLRLRLWWVRQKLRTWRALNRS
jgi:hypothetical protein